MVSSFSLGDLEDCGVTYDGIWWEISSWIKENRDDVLAELIHNDPTRIYAFGRFFLGKWLPPDNNHDWVVEYYGFHLDGSAFLIYSRDQESFGWEMGE